MKTAHETPHDALEALVKELGTAGRVARRFHVSDAYLSDIRSGKRRISERIAKELGFELRWVKVGTKTPLSDLEQRVRDLESKMLPLTVIGGFTR